MTNDFDNTICVKKLIINNFLKNNIFKDINNLFRKNNHFFFFWKYVKFNKLIR